MVGDELMKMILAQAGKMTAPKPGAPVAQKIELVIEPGPLNDQLKKLGEKLADRTVKNGIEIKKLYKPGAVDEFLGAVEKGIPEIGPIREQLQGKPQGIVIPQDAIVQLTRRVLTQADEAKK